MIKKVARVFGIAQLLLLLAYMLLEVVNVPDSLSVCMDTPALIGVQIGYPDADGKIVYDRERPFSSFGEMGITRVVLSTRRKLSEMAWGFRNGPCQIKLHSVIVKKWLVVPFELTAASIISHYRMTDGMSAQVAGDGSLVVNLENDNGYFILKDGKSIPLRLCLKKDFVLLLFGVELLLLVLSLIAVVCKLPEEGIPLKMAHAQILIVSSVVALFFCLILPLQSYLVNRMSWPFTLTELIIECSGNFAICFLVFSVALYVLRFGFGRIPVAILLSAAICGYLETGILSIGLPSLNGDMGYFAHNPGRGILDTSVLLLIMTILVLPYKWINRYYHYVALGFIIMMIASIFDVKVEDEISEEDSLVHTFCSSEKLVDGAFYSGKTNNLVFILDTVTTEVVMDILDQDKSIEDALSGFTAYTNNVGMHHMTVVGLPGITLGKYLDKRSAMRRYEMSFASEDSFFAPYISSKTPTFFMLSLTHPYNYNSEGRTVTDGLKEKSCNKINPLKRRLKGLQAWNLFETLRFRLTPFRFKFSEYLMTIKDWPMYEKDAVEFALFPKLGRLPVRENANMTLHVYHTVGAHAPFFTDRFGRKLSSPGSGYEAYFEKAYFVIHSLVKLFDELKRRGVYDNSFIIVTADHGSHLSKRETVSESGEIMSGAIAFPVLMVKPIGAVGSLRRSDVPTSHSKIASLVKMVRSKAVTESEISEILHEDIRLFRYFSNGTHRDWRFFPDGKITCKSIEDSIDK